MTVLLVALGGMFGAPARYLADRLIQSRHDSVFPWGTLAVNVAGSALLGFLLGAQHHLGVPASVIALAGTGFCGGLTTFSTLAYETLRLLEDGAIGAAGLNMLGSLAVGLLAAYLGHALGFALLVRLPARTGPTGPDIGADPREQATLGAHVELSAVGAERDEAAWRVPGRLIVRTVAVPDPGDLIGALPEPDALAWVRRGDGLVGWGTAARITLPAGQDRFLAAEKWLRELFDSARVEDALAVPGSGPVAFGSFTFDPTSDGSVLVVPRAVLGRRDGQAWLTTIGSEPESGSEPEPGPEPEPESEPESGSGSEPGAAAGPRPGDSGACQADPPVLPTPVPRLTPDGIRWADGNLTPPQWERAVASAVAAISAGNLRKIVLALELNATAAADIDSRVLLDRLAERYPDCYTFACAGLVGATPELLIRRTDRQLHSLVLAGTVPRGGTPYSDDALGATLLASAKNQDEHQYAVADVRAALRPLCADLRVEPQPSLLRLANVQHLATQVSGELAAGEATSHSALALAAALHPTAAVCGTPAEAAMELIRELEGMDRGRYSGPVGWVDAKGNGEWGIALRCAQVTGKHARLIAGCGIVAGSEPSAELAEAQTKFWPMRHALEC
ncbi:MAG TPA: fluoride efflux transporter CrcB [Streptosporangiaceae bacterium]|nr:fluoride efflux transporter CrcB [Streptosporangiaceae bacterium]